MSFIKATKVIKKARIGLAGPAGSGKTLSALLMAQVFGKRIAVIDAENYSSVAYAGDVKLNGKIINIEFDVNPLEPPYSIDKYLLALGEAEETNYDVVIIDGISPAWAGEGGFLDKVDKIAARSNAKNSFFAWRTVTPEHNKFIDAMLHCKTNLIVTMRSKVEYALVENDKGKVVPKKIGLAPIQREGMDYEFDIVFDIDINHSAVASKDRSAMFDGLIIDKLTAKQGKMISDWCNKGERAPVDEVLEKTDAIINKIASYVFVLTKHKAPIGADKNEMNKIYDKLFLFHTNKKNSKELLDLSYDELRTMRGKLERTTDEELGVKNEIQEEPEQSKDILMSTKETQKTWKDTVKYVTAQLDNDLDKTGKFLFQIVGVKSSSDITPENIGDKLEIIKNHFKPEESDEPETEPTQINEANSA